MALIAQKEMLPKGSLPAWAARQWRQLARMRRTSSSTTALATAEPSYQIEASKGWVALRLDELWNYRELLYFLTWRDIKVRYKQTALGAAWAILQPFATMVVFSLFFGRLAEMPAGGAPYPLFV